MSPSGVKLPPALIRVIQILGLTGMLIGVLLCYHNQQPLGMSMCISAGLGVAFAWAARYIMIKFMYYHMEAQLEAAAKEKEAAMKAEAIARDEKKKKADEEAAKLKAENTEVAAKTAATKSK